MSSPPSDRRQNPAADRLNSLIRRISELSPSQMDEVERFITRVEYAVAPRPAEQSLVDLDWPHAPLHRLQEAGTDIVTAGTWNKEHFFRSPSHLDVRQEELLSAAERHGWQLEAWACFSNHYHFVGHSPADATSLKRFLSEVHTQSAKRINRCDGTAGRKVWFNFWETQLTYEKSYLARLNYVHQNARKHGLVRVANQYPWCSAAWFERTARPAQIRTVYGFKTDRIRVLDDYEVTLEWVTNP